MSRARLFAGILVFGLLAMTARNAIDPDLWWHLRTGETIAQTGHVPRVDSFSFTRAGHPWVSHEWLSEYLLYEILKHSGWAGLIAFSSIVTSAGFVLLYCRCRGERHWALAATILGALASAPAWGVRPQMFTFLLFSILLWLLERGEHRPRLLLWIPPLFLLWVNLHAGFALAPALMLAYAAGLAWEGLAADCSWRFIRPLVGRVVLLVVACAVLVPLNPSGLQLYRFPLDVLRSSGIRSMIVEWASPNFHQFRYGALLVIYLALLAVCASGRARPKARVLLPLAALFVGSLDAVRHIPIFVLIAMPVLAAAVPARSARWDVAPGRMQGMGSRNALNVVVLGLVLTFAVVRWQQLIKNQSSSEGELYPRSAMEFLASHPGPSRLFAYYDWGGYAIWSLYPEYRVFVDGRADLYGDDLLRDFQDVVELRRGWQRVLEQWQVEVVLVPRWSALAQALRLSGAWTEQYGDSQAIVFGRAASAVKPAWTVQIRCPEGQKSEKICTRALLNLRN